MGARYLIMCYMWVQRLIMDNIIYSLKLTLFDDMFLFHLSEKFWVRLFFLLKQDFNYVKSSLEAVKLSLV